MLGLENTVGKNGRNQKHDVALVQAALRLVGLWKGKIDGDWPRNSKALEQALLLAAASLKVRPTNPGQIAPRSNLSEALKKKLPREYQSLVGIRNTHCLTIETGRKVQPLLAVKDLSLPDRCKADIQTLQKEMKDRLGLELVITGVDADSSGRCVIQLSPKYRVCLDETLKPIGASYPAPRPVRDIIQSRINSLGQLQMNYSANGIEIKTSQPVHRPEAVRASGPGATMTAPRLSSRFLEGSVGLSGNKLEDVAVIQATLSNVKAPDGHALWNRAISGKADRDLVEAIKAFQMSIGEQASGIIDPHSNTEAALINFAPKDFQKVKSLPGSGFVYIASHP